MDGSADAPFPPLPASGKEWALFLDVDGTLADFAPRPEQVVISPALIAALAALTGLMDGAVAIISGRPIDQIDALFAPLHLPAAGLHGLERREAADSGTERADIPGWHGAVAEKLQRFADARDGVWIEDKGLTLAVHYRGAAEHDRDARRLADEVAGQGHEGLTVQAGKMIIEFRPAGPDKGDMIETFLGHAPFAGRIPAFIGDDVTDEHGFRAINRRGGYSIRVGHAPHTDAAWCIPTVEQTEAWLLDMAKTLRERAVAGAE